MAFASSFTAVLGMSRWLMTGTRDPERRPRGVVTELVCVVLTGKGMDYVHMHVRRNECS